MWIAPQMLNKGLKSAKGKKWEFVNIRAFLFSFVRIFVRKLNFKCVTFIWYFCWNYKTREFYIIFKPLAIIVLMWNQKYPTYDKCGRYVKLRNEVRKSIGPSIITYCFAENHKGHVKTIIIFFKEFGILTLLYVSRSTRTPPWWNTFSTERRLWM